MAEETYQKNKAQTFSAILQAGHKQAALEVPFDPAKVWKLPTQKLWLGRRGHRVHVVCGTQAFDSAIVGRSRQHWLLVDDAIRDSAGWQIGETLQLIITPANESTDADPAA